MLLFTCIRTSKCQNDRFQLGSLHQNRKSIECGCQSKHVEIVQEICKVIDSSIVEVKKNVPLNTWSILSAGKI